MINKYADKEIKEFLTDSGITRIAKIIDNASLSILELLEYGLTRKEINHALSNNIITFDKTPEKFPTDESGHVPTSDYYFSFLTSKVKLTELGLVLLQHVKDNKL
jgi:hypothetical protein